MAIHPDIQKTANDLVNIIEGYYGSRPGRHVTDLVQALAETAYYQGKADALKGAIQSIRTGDEK